MPTLRGLGLLVLLTGGVCSAFWPPKVLPPNTTGDGGPAIEAQIDGPLSIAFDQDDDLYVYQQANDWIGIQWKNIILGSIRRIDSSTNKIGTVAVGCNPPFEKHASSGCVESIGKIRVARSGKLLILEPSQARVRSFDPWTQQFSLIAGDRARLAIAEDPDGNILIGDYAVVLRVDVKTGAISTVAGTGTRGFSGDGGPATSAELNFATQLAVDHDGNLYIGDSGNKRIRRVDAKTGITQTVVGHGGARFRDEVPSSDPVGTWVGAVTVDPGGNLLFATERRVFRLDRIKGMVTAVAGTGEIGSSGDGGSATQARIDPGDMAVDRGGNIFFTEYLNARIRRVDAKTGIITTFAGTGLPHRNPPPGG